MFLSSKYLTVSQCSSIGTLALHSDYVPTLDNDTFAIISTQPSKMQGEHSILIANFCQILYFADSLGRKK